tara:strand:- start:322 stop:528 length:207 start_codon:yes stop_codon:yes gene_type:complete
MNKLKKLFKRKIKVTFYMKSGNVIKLKFISFEIDKLSGNKGNRKLNYDGCSDGFTVDLDEIEFLVIHN